jgi:DNA-binding CsgD family transcriptional regulator
MMAFHRGAGAEDFDAAETALLSACFPHLNRAVETHAAFQRARRFDTAVQDALDGMAQPVWVLRDDATVDHANRRACDLMRRAAWLSQSNDRLMRIGDLDHAAIRAAIAPSRGHAPPVCTAAYVERGRALRAIVRCAPLRGVHAYATAWPHAVALLSLELPPELDARAWVGRLAAQYRFTPAEQRLLERLAAGATLEEVADEQHVARTTVRTHLRSLFDKTGVRRQSELVRLALGA